MLSFGKRECVQCLNRRGPPVNEPRMKHQCGRGVENGLEMNITGYGEGELFEMEL